MSEFIKQAPDKQAPDKQELSRGEKLARVLFAITFALSGIYGCKQTIDLAIEQDKKLDENCGEDRSLCLTEETLVCTGFFTNDIHCEESIYFVTPTPGS